MVDRAAKTGAYPPCPFVAMVSCVLENNAFVVGLCVVQRGSHAYMDRVTGRRTGFNYSGNVKRDSFEEDPSVTTASVDGS